MSDDLQLDVLARVGPAVKGLELVDVYLKRIEASTKRVNKAQQDQQKGAVGMLTKFTGIDRKALDFIPVFTNINETKKALAGLPSVIKRGGVSMQDFQQQASTSFLKLKEDINITKGVAISVGPAVAGVVAGIAAAGFAAIRVFKGVDAAIEASKQKAASLGATGADQEIAAATGLLGSGANIDAATVSDAALGAQGPVKQEQISAFLAKAVKEGAFDFLPSGAQNTGINTQQVNSLVRSFAANALVPGADDELIGQFRASAGQSTFSDNLTSSMAAIRASAPGAVAVREQQRGAEVLVNRASRTDAARIEAINVAQREARASTRAVADAEVEQTSSTIQGIGRRIGGAAMFVGGVADSGLQLLGKKDATEQSDTTNATNALNNGKPLKVEVVNSPRPVDGGY